MKESGNYYQDNNSFWNYVKDNPGIVNLPVSESKGLDLLSALRDIREAYIKNAEQGDKSQRYRRGQAHADSQRHGHYH